jgi:quercetin dioxygenase-like cupin family protein
MLESGSFDAPQEVVPFTDKGRAEFVTVGGHRILRGYYEPGWRWSEHLKPIVKTDSCQITHTGYVVSGRMAVRMDDGQEAEVGPGDAFAIGSGHDAWVVGDEAVVLLDFTGGKRYAKPA